MSETPSRPDRPESARPPRGCAARLLLSQPRRRVDRALTSPPANPGAGVPRAATRRRSPARGAIAVAVRFEMRASTRRRQEEPASAIRVLSWWLTRDNDPTDLGGVGATIVVAQALCLTTFNLSPARNTCPFTDGSNASVCVCVCVRERELRAQNPDSGPAGRWALRIWPRVSKRRRVRVDAVSESARGTRATMRESESPRLGVKRRQKRRQKMGL